jgi:hypothetical protein
METEAPCYTWRRTSGAAPDAVKAARPVLNGGREETYRKVTRLAPTQRRGAGDQTGYLWIKRATIWSLREGGCFKGPPAGRLCAGFPSGCQM